MPGEQSLGTDPERPVARYSVSPDESPSHAVLSAFEAVDGRPDESSDAVLYDYVDPDALDRLLDGTTQARVEVRLWGHPVVITPSLVTVYERA